MVTTTVIARGSEWSSYNNMDVSDKEYEYLLQKAVNRFHQICKENGFHEIYWQPETSEVIGYAYKDYDIDLDDCRVEAWDFENDYEEEEEEEWRDPARIERITAKLVEVWKKSLTCALHN